MSVLLIAAACAPRSTPPPPPQLPPETARFALVQGATIVASERVRRSDELLEVEMDAPGGIRVTYTAQLRRDASVARLEVRQFAPGAAAADPPMVRSSGVFVGDSVALTLTLRDSTQVARRATVAGVVPYLNPSTSLMEQIVRRARAIGGTRVEVPIWLPNGGGQNARATVEWPAPDSARLTVGPTAIDLRVDPTGRILGGSIPSQGILIERTPGGG